MEWRMWKTNMVCFAVTYVSGIGNIMVLYQPVRTDSVKVNSIILLWWVSFQISEFTRCWLNLLFIAEFIFNGFMHSLIERHFWSRSWQIWGSYSGECSDNGLVFCDDTIWFDRCHCFRGMNCLHLQHLVTVYIYWSTWYDITEECGPKS